MAIKLTDIEKQLNGLKAPNSYQTDKTLQNQITAAENNVLNRKEFSYDFNTDPFYQNYKDQYVRGGKMAMLDTQAGAAALSGGYGNSYAATAGNQAYQQYLSQLNNVIPELYDAAYNRYQNDLAQKRADLSMLTDKENQNYSRYRDTVGDYNQNREYYTGLYTNTRDYDYTAAQDKIANKLKQDQLAETIRANKASEAETSRANRSSEKLAWDKWNTEKEAAKNTKTAVMDGVPDYVMDDIKDFIDDDDRTTDDTDRYLGSLFDQGVITKDQMKVLSSRVKSEKKSNVIDSGGGGGAKKAEKDVSRFTTYEEFVKATGKSGVRTESEFKRDSSDREKYKTYENYLAAMYQKYGNKK